MRRKTTKEIVTVVVVGASLLCPIGLRAGGQEALTLPATDDEITVLIRDLSDPAYAKRTYATRRLCAIGMPGREKLQAAAEGDDVETALRAKAVLSVLDRMMFSGIEVQLAFSKIQTAWDQPVDLRVTLTNSSEYPGRVPFQLSPEERKTTTRWLRCI